MQTILLHGIPTVTNNYKYVQTNFYDIKDFSNNLDIAILKYLCYHTFDATSVFNEVPFLVFFLNYKQKLKHYFSVADKLKQSAKIINALTLKF